MTSIGNVYFANPDTTMYDLVVARSAMKMAVGAMILTLIVALAVATLMIIAMWKVFVKAGKPGWASLIPVYSTVVMFQVAGMNPLLTLILIGNCIPIVNFFASIAWLVISIIAYVNIAKAFGKSGGFAVGMVFLPLIFWCILAFDKSEYLGVPNSQI